MSNPPTSLPFPPAVHDDGPEVGPEGSANANEERYAAVSIMSYRNFIFDGFDPEADAISIATMPIPDDLVNDVPFPMAARVCKKSSMNSHRQERILSVLSPIPQ